MNSRASLSALGAIAPSHRQRGVVLFIALIALVAMTLAAIGLVRSFETGTLIAGNIAFKQSTIHHSDTAVEAAVTELATIATASANTDIANKYFALQQPEDALGVPTSINWANIPCRNTTGAVISCDDASLYRMQYVIDRLCSGALPVTDTNTYCVVSEGYGGGSNKPNAPKFTDADKIFYRITTRITGPRDTRSIVQAIVGYRK